MKRKRKLDPVIPQWICFTTSRLDVDIGAHKFELVLGALNTWCLNAVKIGIGNSLQYQTTLDVTPQAIQQY